MQVVLCSDSPPTDTLKLYCWSDPTPRTACYNTDPAACKFSYTWAVTPVVTAVQPEIGTPGDVLTLQGNAFDDVTAVLLTTSWGAVSCPISNKNSTKMTCIIPQMPAGQYVVSGQSITSTHRVLASPRVAIVILSLREAGPAGTAGRRLSPMQQAGCQLGKSWPGSSRTTVLGDSKA